MSCNCPDTNKCPTDELCLCGVDLNIYNSEGVLVETINGNIFQGDEEIYFVAIGSTAFDSLLEPGYTLTISYNSILERWEMSYYNNSLEINILLGVLYSEDDNCPISNCWDLDCIAVGFNVLGVFDTYFDWQGGYTNDKKSYTFSSDWSGTNINYRIYWTSDSSVIVGSGAPANTPAWILEEENPFSPGVWSPTGFLFNSNQCPYGQYIVEFGGLDTRFSFDDLGVTGYDLKTNATDCECCDESVLINVTFDSFYYADVIANVVKDEYGNAIGINGKQYYEFEISLTPTPATFYLYYTGTSWVMSDSINGEGEIYAELNSSNDCPFGPYALPRLGNVTSFSVVGSDCFDCCDYDTPKNRNLLKKKKAIFVEEISAIRNQELFGLKCGGSWDDLFRKHLIFDVLWCLPYGKICDEEQQCLINNLNENCNC
jgi:hypothetical protein